MNYFYPFAIVACFMMAFSSFKLIEPYGVDIESRWRLVFLVSFIAVLVSLFGIIVCD